jgi:hypothetical protein
MPNQSKVIAFDGPVERPGGKQRPTGRGWLIARGPRIVNKRGEVCQR